MCFLNSGFIGNLLISRSIDVTQFSIKLSSLIYQFASNREWNGNGKQGYLSKYRGGWEKYKVEYWNDPERENRNIGTVNIKFIEKV